MNPRLALYLLAALAGLYTMAPITDGDLFWNLNIGRWMLDNLALLPADDPFTYNAQPGGVQHEWLLQVIFAAVESFAGLNGLRALGGLIGAASIVLVYVVFVRRGIAAGDAVVAAALWWIVVEPHAVLRPHLAGWLFALAVIGIGFESCHKKNENKRLVALFIACVVWGNAHASVLIAPAYAGLFLVGRVLAAVSGRGDRATVSVWAKRVAATGAGAMIQPAHVLLIPYALSTPAINKELSFEWWPLLRADVWVSRPGVLIVWGLLVVAVIAVAALQLRAPSEDCAGASDPSGTSSAPVHDFPGVLVAAFALAHAALTRRMTVFLFIPMLLIARAFMSRVEPAGLLAARVRALLPWIAVVFVVFQYGTGARAALRVRPLVAAAFPIDSTAFLRETKLDGRLFNPDGWGGYIAWRVPGRRVFADGRWPLVGGGVIHDGFEIMLRRKPTEPLHDKYRIDSAIFRLAEYMRVPGPDPKQWVLAWRDELSVVMLRRGPFFAANVERTCDFYRRFEGARDRARWAVTVRAPQGVVSPTAAPSVLDLCAPAE